MTETFIGIPAAASRGCTGSGAAAVISGAATGAAGGGGDVVAFFGGGGGAGVGFVVGAHVCIVL